MRKQAWLIVVVAILVLVVAVALNGDRLYEMLVRMHGGNAGQGSH